MKTLSKSICLALGLILSGSALAAMHSEGDGLPKGKPGEGHCMLQLQNNMMDEKVASCEQPANAAGCKVLGTTDDNSDAKHSAGDCPMKGAKASCDTGEIKWLYYSGDYSGMEIGCGFQGGDWADY